MTIVHNRDGFSLIELLVAVALSVIIMAAIYSTYYSQQKSFIVQEQLAAMQQNLRAAMFYMEREIRMAGCDPTRKAGAGVTTADATSLRFTEDTDGDTVLVSITYSLYTDTDGIQKLGRDTGGGAIPVADNIEVIDFVYLDGASPPNVLNDPVTNNVLPANIPDIRAVQVTVVARTGREDLAYTDTTDFYNQNDLVNPIWLAINDHYRRKALSSNIKCRNLGL